MAASVEPSEAIETLAKGIPLISNIKFIIISSGVGDCSVN